MVLYHMVKTVDYLKLCDGMHLDVQYESLIKDGVILSLSKTEFRILFYLTINKNKIVSFENLINFSWKLSSTVTRRELYVYIARIRKKLDLNTKIVFIRNKGYIFID